MEQSKFYQIKNITEHEYTLVDCDGSVITRPIQDVDKSASAFTIQDAKDGDVLATEDWVFIFKKINSYGKPICYCHYDIELGFRIDTNSYIATGSEIYPATKEQRAPLFQKMKEAGYEWDAEKKELKKIEQKPILDVEIPFGAKDSELEEVTYSIPNGYHAEIEDNKVVIKQGEKKYVESDKEFEDFVRWFVKQRTDDYTLIPSDDDIQKWTIMILEHARKVLNNKQKSDKIICNPDTCIYVKNYRDIQKPAEWSKEDKIMLDEIIDFFENGTVKLQHDLSLYASWLKSLKDRYTWRPSKEQMKALNTCIMQGEISYVGQGPELQSLYNDLKKLTE